MDSIPSTYKTNRQIQRFAPDGATTECEVGTRREQGQLPPPHAPESTRLLRQEREAEGNGNPAGHPAQIEFTFFRVELY